MFFSRYPVLPLSAGTGTGGEQKAGITAGKWRHPVPAPADQAQAEAPAEAPVPVAIAPAADPADPAQAKLERRRASARDYQRRRRQRELAARKAGTSRRTCAECPNPLPPGRGKATKFCSRRCRNIAGKRAAQPRAAAGPPVGQSWPPAVIEIADKLRYLEGERQFAEPERRQELATSIRRLTAELDRAKVAVMNGEGRAA